MQHTVLHSIFRELQSISLWPGSYHFDSNDLRNYRSEYTRWNTLHNHV